MAAQESEGTAPRSRRGRRLCLAAAIVAVLLLLLYLGNASWRGSPANAFTVLSHRGVHQTYSHEDLGPQDCTATRIIPPAHPFLENTVPSVREAFRMGADMVEIDIHPTTDGEFAVFHDWTIDCRTDGRGITREQSMAHLRTLDIGYGYTADGGRTFPFRGRATGMMPTLAEMLAAFPQSRFQINIKSNDPAEAERLHAYLGRHRVEEARLEVIGGERPVRRLRALRPSLRSVSKEQTIACLKAYMVHGWRGHVPPPCRNTSIMVPASHGWLLWGWPDLFLDRMQAANTRVTLLESADLRSRRYGTFDSVESLNGLPGGWRGGLMTNRIERIAPALPRLREQAIGE
ncbi:glycerophosphodiester phosphodiesterase family protein [Sphingosinicella terrae]|uniref:glycerophosphodiester phosphodiesterase family protein n=1 Tax=Sphingosinicella terrae TaxID=2172047 RepID=UPI000E0D6946|nr:glycerophosphodiester phosphodiesterase family protein [Sphingosinicella terrae]